jgi:UDP-N-acetylglucosamine--N-acetylmuramyl-(pentapeptide) pyrophosphoryl-undecaprenol N-acetylglucosamine transferase
MKILLTGGGTGGHFYPVIAVAEAIHDTVKKNRLLQPELYYMSTDPYNEGLLFENNITFVKVSAGKIRRHLSLPNLIMNAIDAWKTFVGVVEASWKMYTIYPDVVFGKGGYASFPALFAARLLKIPVIIHESDSTPGKVTAWAGKFAERIAISYPEAAQYFAKDKTAYTGNPIRKEVIEPLTSNSHTLLSLDPNIGTILVLGGSQGAQVINEIVLNTLPELVKKYQVIHQVGKRNIQIIKEIEEVVLQNNPHKDHYKPYEYLNLLNLRAAAGVADLIISRAGSTIFEIASWGKPSIIIPIPEPTSHDQRKNAYAYARSGAAEVIEEKNLEQGVFLSEVNRLMENKEEREKMHVAALAFSRRDAATLIAEQVLGLALSHEV